MTNNYLLDAGKISKNASQHLGGFQIFQYAASSNELKQRNTSYGSCMWKEKVLSVFCHTYKSSGFYSNAAATQIFFTHLYCIFKLRMIRIWFHYQWMERIFHYMKSIWSKFLIQPLIKKQLDKFKPFAASFPIRDFNVWVRNQGTTILWMIYV